MDQEATEMANNIREAIAKLKEADALILKVPGFIAYSEYLDAAVEDLTNELAELESVESK